MARAAGSAEHRRGRGRAPPSRAIAQAAIAGATSGTTPRFTTGKTIASRPNESQDHGQRRGLGDERHPARHSVSQPRQTPGSPATSEPGAERRPPRPGSPPSPATRGWKPASRTSPGSTSSISVAAQPSAAVARPARPLSRAISTTPAIAARAHDRRRCPGGDDIGDDRRRVAERHAPPRSPAEGRRDQPATIAMFQPEIATTWLAPAVAKSAARSRSTRSRSPRGCQRRGPPRVPGARAGARRRRRPAQRLQREPAGGEDRQLPRVEACRDPGPSQVLAVRVALRRRAGGRRPDAIAGRPPGTRAASRRPAPSRASLAGEPCDLVPFRGAPTDSTTAGPWTALLGQRRRRRRRRADEHPQRQQRGPAADRPGGRAGSPSSPACRGPARGAPGPRRAATTAGTPARRPTRPPRPRPRASRPRHRPARSRSDGHERPQLLERRRAHDLPRREVVDRCERLFLARGDDLGGRCRTHAGQRVELLGGRRVQVDGPPPAPPAGAAVAGPPRRRRLAPDRDPDLVTVASGAARFSSRSARVASTRGP